MSNFEPWQSASRQRSTRTGMIAVAAIIALTFAAMGGLMVWAFRPQRQTATPASVQTAAPVQIAGNDSRAPTPTLLPIYTLDDLDSVMRDNFENNDAGWPEESQAGDPGWNVAVQDGAYLWELTTSTNYVLRYNLDSMQRVADFGLSVDVEQLAGPAASYGLIFRSNAQRYYQFEISQSGSFVVFVAFSDSRRGPMVSRATSSAINRNGANRLTVIGQADSFAFYINDILVAQERHGTFRDGRVGLSLTTSGTNDPVRVKFDNFQVYLPPAEDE
jgi:hypothetical protein